MERAPHSRLGSFEILSLLGTGGMGAVYRAKDLELGRSVAIKVLKEELFRDPTHLERFKREARAASALNHPNIITTYEIGVENETHFLVMEYVDGSTLRDIKRALPLDELLQLAAQIADGLAKAHEAGIMYRDLKPENMMLTQDGLIKILDFGLAKFFTGHEPGSEELTMERQLSETGVISAPSPICRRNSSPTRPSTTAPTNSRSARSSTRCSPESVLSTSLPRCRPSSRSWKRSPTLCPATAAFQTRSPRWLCACSRNRHATASHRREKSPSA